MGLNRQTSARVGGVLLFATAGVVIVQSALSGSFGFVLLNLPALAAGYAVLQRWPWARAGGLIMAVVYAAFWTIVATTPLRGITPPPGQDRPPLDPYSVALAGAFVVSAALIGFGRVAGRARSDI
jgi:hypothetical protein